MHRCGDKPLFFLTHTITIREIHPSGLYTGLDSPFSSFLTGLIGGFSGRILEIPSNIGSIVKWAVLERNKPALTDPIGLNPFFRMTCNPWGWTKMNETTLLASS
jgi:hypothetical protein